MLLLFGLIPVASRGSCYIIVLRFYKNILGVKKSTQNDFVFGELGRTPMVVVHRLGPRQVG